MSSNINKITDADLAGKGVPSLPDIPSMSPAELKAKFEETATRVVIPKINQIIDYLNNLNMDSGGNIIDAPDATPDSRGLMSAQDKRNVDAAAAHLTDADAHAALFAAKAPATTRTTEFASAPADNTLYVCTIDSAVSITAATAESCPLYGAHYVLTFAEGGEVTATYDSYQGDDISTAAAGEVWEISILRGGWIVKRTKEAA